MFRSRFRRVASAAAIIGTMLCGLVQAGAADRALYLDVIVNGYAIGLIGDFVQRDGDILASPDELRALGFLVPGAMATQPDGLVRLADIPGLAHSYDEAGQTLTLTADNAVRDPARLSAARPALQAQNSGFGVLLNYSLVATRAAGQDRGSMLAEPRMFLPWGVVEGAFIAETGPGEAVTRLDTTWTYEDQDSLLRTRVGDFIGGSLPWTRPVRLGGVQIARDFAMRPDLITFPIPELRGAADVPSTVDVYIDNVKQFSGEVKPGPFEVLDLPVVTGQGDARIVVRDAQGRETVRSMPFYASSSLLRTGLVDYAADLGVIRHGYGDKSFSYRGLAGSGSIRYGLNDDLTLEAHVETGPGLVMGGGGFVAAIGEFGTANAALAVSDTAKGTGAQYAVGYEYRSRRWNVRLSRIAAIGPFADLAALDGSPAARSVSQVSVGLTFNDGGSLGLAYVGIDRGTEGRSRIVSGSYARPLTRTSQIMTTAFVDLDDPDNAGAMVSVAMPLGETTDIGADASVQNGRFLATARAAYTERTGVADRGYSLYGEMSQGDLSRYAGRADWRTRWADFGLAADAVDGEAGVRAEMRGAVVFGEGDFFLAQRIDDSFAIVDAGLPDVGVMLENRPAGRTNANGLLLVKGLRAYEANAMAIDVVDLPPDADYDAARRVVVPSYRGGVVVQFAVRAGAAAVVTVVDGSGQPVAAGSTMMLQGGVTAPVGYDGIAYISDLASQNEAAITRPDGSVCRFSFPFTPTPGFVPTLGPFTCAEAAS